MEKPVHPIFISEIQSGFDAGGKGKNLFQLRSLGFNVPAFVVIPAQTTPKLKDPFFLNGGFKEAFHHSLVSHFISQSKQKAADLRFAVRSSAMVEDGIEDSFAGQFESFLNVPVEKVLDRVIEVIDSASSERVHTYLKSKNRLFDSVQMAVVIQLMLEADVSGVAFGIDPLTGNRSTKVINALYGIGDGLVSGILNADTFMIYSNGKIESVIANKQEKVSFNRNSGTILTPVSAEIAELPSLTDEQILHSGKVLDQLELHFHHPQDIEFCIVENEFFLLQTRPITTKIHPQNKEKNLEERLIWDNSNIVESYPGHTLPLTFSFIIKMYEAVYAQLMNILGINQAEIESNRNALSNMLGLIDGRVYYNLLNWYRTLALIPGFAINAKYMEKMMGVKESLPIDNLTKRSKGKEWFRIARLIWSLLFNLFSLNKMRRQFEHDFGLVMQKYNAFDFDQKSVTELLALYQEYETTLLKKWKAPMVNDFFVMIFFGLLQKLVVKYEIDPEGTLHNDLISGAKDIISTEPINLTYQLVDAIRADNLTLEKFNQQSPDELEALFLKGEFPEPINGLINNYLAKWGNRVAGELKLETITYKQKPALYLNILQAYLRQNISTDVKHQELDIRLEAEKKVKQKLKNKPLKKWIFGFVLKRSREMVTGRELLRYARTKGYGVVREIFNAIGKQFAQEGIIDQQADIFYLTQQEIFTFIKGTSVNNSLKWIVVNRKKEYEMFKNLPAPAERFETFGMVNAGNTFGRENTPFQASESGKELKGIGCSAGIVQGKVKIVLNPNDAEDLNGDILVTVFTDPGWVTLFPTSSAIIVEKGSLLSHSAIVSREMNIPCIVAVSNVTKILKTGDEILMDGKTGIIKILS